MGSVSSEEASDLQSERFGSYSLSADVSESESCSSRYDVEGVSGSTASSPLPQRLGSLNSSFPVKMPVILPVIGGKDVVFWERKMEKRDTQLSEIDMMKERFSKLLLGEDMSGGGKGVCSALAISNAITNLSASVFGELWRLEPLAPQKKALWCREMEWLLCVSDSIVELTPSIQEFPGGEGRHFEVMVSRPRPDLYVNLPALKKLDAMLLSMLDGFQETEFWYVDRGILLADGEDAISCPSSSSSGRPSLRNEEKWWLPSPRVPTKGLSDEARKRLLKCRDCTNQILKAAIAINSNVLAEMEIPAPYMDTLPKNGKSCLGDIIYRYITSEHFTPECLLDCLDLTSEHQTLEIANRIEAAIHVWKQKDRKRHLIHTKSRKPSWGGKVKSLVNDLEKSHNLAQRAESLLHGLRARYPILPQTLLDMNKIQYNRDVGQAILESYSRVMESVAFNIMARIDDIVYVDDTVKQCANVEKTVPTFNRGGLGSLPLRKKISPSPFSIQHSPYSSPFATPTLSSSPANGSPMRKLERMIQGESERFWSFTRSLSATIDTDDALQRE